MFYSPSPSIYLLRFCFLLLCTFLCAIACSDNIFLTDRYTQAAYELFQEAFWHIPLCAVLGKKVFVVHGGLFAKDGVTIQDINKVNRIREPPDSGVCIDWGHNVCERNCGIYIHQCNYIVF